MHPAAQPLTPVLVPYMVCIVTDVPCIITSSPQHQQEAVSPLAAPAALIKQGNIHTRGEGMGDHS